MIKKRGVKVKHSSKFNSKITHESRNNSNLKTISNSKSLHYHIKKHASIIHNKIKHHTNKLHNKVIHHYRRRKHIEYEQLPHWKKGMLEFNHRFFGWLMEFIEKAIPLLVLLLLFIIIAELGHNINGLLHNWFNTEWHFLEVMAQLAHNYHYYIVLIDQIIISFFILDLYFNFFRKATLTGFLRTYFLDILAVLPLGLVVGAFTKEVSTAQSATHVLVDTERIATRSLEAEKIASESFKVEKVATESFKAQRFVKYLNSHKALRLITRLPRLLRLYRLSALFVPSSMKKKTKIKKLSKRKISTNKKTIKKKTKKKVKTRKTAKNKTKNKRKITRNKSKK